jgi:hypothetical protein
VRAFEPKEHKYQEPFAPVLQSNFVYPLPYPT